MDFSCAKRRTQNDIFAKRLKNKTLSEKTKLYTYSGKTSIQSVFGENIFYRDLNPVSSQYLSFEDIRKRLNIRQKFPPRKASRDYASVILEQVKLRASTELRQILFFGDTPGNDGSVVRNLETLSKLPVFGFIGKEAIGEEKMLSADPPIFLANRWELVSEFLAQIQQFGFRQEVKTAVLFDMDKTLIGARGRNDHVIDDARMDGVKKLIKETLKNEWQEDHFLLIYKTFNEPAYHFLTEDNQDYLAFVCLMVLADVWSFEELVDQLIRRKITSFQEFLTRTASRLQKRPISAVAPYFEEVFLSTVKGDPTPFKSFRRMEYLATIERIDCVQSEDPAEILRSEITLTQEILDLVSFLKKKQFSPIVCISDKPPESTFPSDELKQQGYLPLHQMPMKIVGKSLTSQLRAH